MLRSPQNGALNTMFPMWMDTWSYKLIYIYTYMLYQDCHCTYLQTDTHTYYTICTCYWTNMWLLSTFFCDMLADKAPWEWSPDRPPGCENKTWRRSCALGAWGHRQVCRGKNCWIMLDHVGSCWIMLDHVGSQGLRKCHGMSMILSLAFPCPKGPLRKWLTLLK